MNKYTTQLLDVDNALALFRRHPVDAVSEPEGYERGYNRQLGKSHGDFADFRQTVMKTAQKIVRVTLDKKIKHTITAGACGAAGALHVKAKVGDDADAVPAYFLPWDQRGGSVQMTIPSGGGTDLNAHPQLFFTAALSGCSILIKGTPSQPTIIHAGSGQLPLPYDANKFWKDFVEHLDSHPDPAIKHRKSGLGVKAQATKSEYVTGIEIDDKVSFTGKSKTTQHAVDYHRKLSKHYGDTVEIANVAPWGAVFGVRRGSDWTFYLQENANITYYPRRKIQQVLEYTKGAPVYLPDKWVREMGPEHIVSRPMALQVVFPEGGAKAELTNRWRSLLRTDPLSDSPAAYPHEG